MGVCLRHPASRIRQAEVLPFILMRAMLLTPPLPAKSAFCGNNAP
jgi:hypothetical protein